MFWMLSSSEIQNGRINLNGVYPATAMPESRCNIVPCPGTDYQNCRGMHCEPKRYVVGVVLTLALHGRMTCGEYRRQIRDALIKSVVHPHDTAPRIPCQRVLPGVLDLLVWGPEDLFVML